MKTLYFALAATLLAAAAAIALGLAEFNARWLWDVRAKHQDAHLLSWLQYAQMSKAYLWRAILNPMHTVLAVPVVAIVLLHRSPVAQAGMLMIQLAFLALDVSQMLTLENSPGSRCGGCSLQLFYHALFGAAATAYGLVYQACYWAWLRGSFSRTRPSQF